MASEGESLVETASGGGARGESLAMHSNYQFLRSLKSSLPSLSLVSSLSSNVLGYILEVDGWAFERSNLKCWSFSLCQTFWFMGVILFGASFFGWPSATFYVQILMLIFKHTGIWSPFGLSSFWKPGFWMFQCQYLCSLFQCDGHSSVTKKNLVEHVAMRIRLLDAMLKEKLYGCLLLRALDFRPELQEQVDNVVPNLELMGLPCLASSSKYKDCSPTKWFSGKYHLIFCDILKWKEINLPFPMA